MECVKLKRIKIVARQMIIGIHNDDGLKALDGYYEEILEIINKFDPIRIVENFEKEHPEFASWDIQIEEV